MKQALNKLKLLIGIGIILISGLSCKFHADILDPPPVSEGKIRFYTQISGGHQHIVDVYETDILQAPDSSYYETSVVGHFHSLIIYRYEFELLQDGYTLETQTTTVNGHYHDVIMKYSGAPVD